MLFQGATEIYRIIVPAGSFACLAHDKKIEAGFQQTSARDRRRAPPITWPALAWGRNRLRG